MKNPIGTWMMAELFIGIFDFLTVSAGQENRFDFSNRNLDRSTNHESLLNEKEISSEAISNLRGATKISSGGKSNSGASEFLRIDRKAIGKNQFFLDDYDRTIGNRSISSSSSSFSSTGENDYYLIGFAGNPFSIRGGKLNFSKSEISDKDSLGGGISRGRRKRSVSELYGMLVCATGCNPVRYKGYGCYCGFLGSGYVVDGIDSCCKMHDRCYHRARCPPFLEYFTPYLWKCDYHRPLCAVDHGHYGRSGSCSKRLCECDRQLALCLKRYPCPTTKALCTSSPWRLLQNILSF